MGASVSKPETVESKETLAERMDYIAT